MLNFGFKTYFWEFIMKLWWMLRTNLRCFMVAYYDKQLGIWKTSSDLLHCIHYLYGE